MIGAVDIGGTKIAVGMVDESGRVLSRAECPTAPEQGLADGLNRIAALLRQTAAQAGGELRGIGVGCTGPVDPLTGIIIGENAFLPGWENVSLSDELAGRLNVPAVVENDADAAALGESWWGAGRGVSKFIYVTVSTGIGGGLVFDGQLYRGADGAHPEIGHHVIDPSGPRCFCGACGCWESLAAGPALARWFKDACPAGLPGVDAPDARQICDAAAQGHRQAQAAVAHEAAVLGLGLANLVTLFSPDVIALGGGVMRSWPLFSEIVHSTIHSNCGLVPHQKTRLVPAALGTDTGIIGAACAWLHRTREL